MTGGSSNLPLRRTGATDVVLAGHRLRLTTEYQDLLGDALSVLVPPCSTNLTGPGEDLGWSIHVSIASDGTGPLQQGGRPALVWADSGRRLTILDATDGGLTLAGQYRTDADLTLIEVDLHSRQTRVVLPDGDVSSRRWPDWVARVFFGTRLLGDGWLLVHGSAVQIDTENGPRAVLILAGPGGGKSTLAHRACVELSAQHKSDDLVFLRADPHGVIAVGWPTRMCLPVELLDAAMYEKASAHMMVDTVMAGRQRRRLMLSPPEYGALFRVERAGPTRLGAVVAVRQPDDGSAGPRTRADLDIDALQVALAEAASVPAQRLMMLDILGVTGPPATTSAVNVVSRDLLARVGLANLPAVYLDIPDSSMLPSMPVWDMLSAHLPWLRGAS